MAENFSTKADTLAALHGKVKSARVAELVSFTHADWLAKTSECLAHIEAKLKAKNYIVRSSCIHEDGTSASNAGAFLSVGDVVPDALEVTINNVFASYGKVNEIDQILIQPMLQNVIRSGVAFSHDPNTHSPYRVISWTEGADTTSVTGGLGGNVWYQAASGGVTHPDLGSVAKMLEELLHIFGGKPLDTEFAITLENGEEVLWLLQARPLILNDEVESDSDQYSRLKLIEEKLKSTMAPHPFLMGSKTVYGVMPDWNPAEIVGIRPKPLALSLYKELVTDSIWAYQRHNYGYRNLRSFPLMPHFMGQPYIDVRLSFNSFIPADLEKGVSDKLVDYYIRRLLKEPTLHDKVEFEIVYSCYTLDLPMRLKTLERDGFSARELSSLSESLRRLTHRIMHPEDGLWKGDAKRLEKLKERRELIVNSNIGKLEKIYWLIEDTKRYGTLPFAGLARAAFVSIQMLKSLVNVEVFTQENYDEFLAAVSTVSGQLAHDRTMLDRSAFLSRYGHLRPGTYDLLSPRYDEAFDDYFDGEADVEAIDDVKPFAITLELLQKIAVLIDDHKLDIDPAGLLEFMKSSIELREYSKFEFTKNLSNALSLITQFGNDYGFSKEEMAFADFSIFQYLYTSASDPKPVIENSIIAGKQRFQETIKLSLPPIISDPTDIWGFSLPDSVGNFITQKQVTAKIVSHEDRKNLAGSIVCIPSADPGYDWLFSYPIAGLITAWGGANSHMAIRAGELGLPALIGVGEKAYQTLTRSNRVLLDCGGRRVEVL